MALDREFRIKVVNMTVKTLRDLTFELMKYILLESFTEIFRRGDKDYYCLTPKEREKDFLKEVNVTLVKKFIGADKQDIFDRYIRENCRRYFTHNGGDTYYVNQVGRYPKFLQCILVLHLPLLANEIYLLVLSTLIMTCEMTYELANECHVLSLLENWAQQQLVVVRKK